MFGLEQGIVQQRKLGENKNQLWKKETNSTPRFTLRSNRFNLRGFAAREGPISDSARCGADHPLVEAATAYRFYLGVYVRSVTRLTPSTWH